MQIINRLEPQFSRLAHGLDTTRHQYPTKGIQLPKKPGMLNLVVGVNCSYVNLLDTLEVSNIQYIQSGRTHVTVGGLCI